MTVDDATLTYRYQKGDRSALDELVARHRSRAYKYAFQLTRDLERASDIVAEAFLRVCRSLMNFRGQSSFSTWLYRIITNCYLDSSKRRPSGRFVSIDGSAVLDSLDLDRVQSDSCSQIQQACERNVERECLIRAIGELPQEYRTIVLLFHSEDRSYADIAEILKLPIGTVKSRLNRARLSLREILEAERDTLLAA